jgi:3-oxoacyl-(acyl-carrier-protein) synthase
MRERVHVAGRGAFSAFGPGLGALLDGVFAGATALRARKRLAHVESQASVAAEVPGSLAHETELPFHMARAAASEALAAARARESIAFVLSSTKADMSGITGPGEGLGSPSRLARRLADDLGLGRPRAAVSCACASGLAALALAARWIAGGRAERVLVAGTDALSPFILRGFDSLLALDPGPCRPFDRERRGLSLGEAAGAILLARGGGEVELAGWGESNDANHITGPSRDGGGLLAAMAQALAVAGTAPGEVDYVHLHGTGTVFNDAMEAVALGRLFEGPTPLASGTKAQTGHTLGAAGVIESLVAIEALRRGMAPGNVGLVESDVDSRVALPRSAARLPRARVALKVAAGFGGINAAAVFRCA